VLCREFLIVKKKKKIDVDTFKDPFTVYASGFAIPIQAETEALDDSKQQKLKRKKHSKKSKK
jgi:hypothetical protein